MATINARNPGASAVLLGQAKLHDVTKILDALAQNLASNNLQPSKQDALLEQLKVYGRDVANSDPIFSQEGITLLARYAYDSTSITTRRNALRCLANALLLNTAARQIYVNLGHEGQACNQLKEGTTEDEFLLGRIIFLTTYGTNLDIEKLVDQHRLAELITFVLKRHAERYVSSEGGTQPADPMNNMALTETLKLLFNVTHFCPQRNGSFSKAVPHILAILMECSLAVTNPMEAPVAQLINALLNLPLDHPENARLLFPEQNKDRHVERLIEILDKSIQTYKDAELEQLVTPLLTVIRRLYEIGPQEAQTCMQRRMLPTEQDREQPVGKGESFSARFLRLSMNITTPQLKESISALLFELSDKDAAAFVQNVGYGFASGFLFQHNVPMPESVLENGSGKDRLKANGKPLNPITGQTLESEPESDANLPEMTQEEKEREAERLFVLFERLQKNGVISVGNPMAEALHQGRFEELDDDTEE